MSIVKRIEGGGLVRRVVLKGDAKMAVAKHPAKKHAAKKHAAKKTPAKHAEKHAAKHAPEHDHAPKENGRDRMGKAFHHLQRASAVVSLLQQDSGGDLRQLLQHAVRVYRIAAQTNSKKEAAIAAHGLARAAEHLSLAGLYLARGEHRIEVPVSGSDKEDKRLSKVRERAASLKPAKGDHSRWLQGLVQTLLARVEDSDPQVAWELVMATDGITEALEEGM